MIFPVPQHLPKFLYHGSYRSKYPTIRPYDCPTYAGDRGKFVFASASCKGAKTYGFKKYAVFSGGYCPSIAEGGAPILMMILAPHVSDPDADIFGELRQQVCYLHKLSSEGFRGVYREGDDLCWPPIEWVSRVSVEVSRPEEIPNEELVQNGLQIFTVNSDVVRARMGLISDDVLCEKFCREQEKIAAEAFFLDVQTRKELGQIGEDLTPLGNLLKAKVLRWENLREEYHSYPDAVPSAMFNLFKRMQAVRSRRRHTRSYRAENRLEL